MAKSDSPRRSLRGDVLTALTKRGEPSTAQQVADDVGAHNSGVFKHLRGLEGEGLVHYAGKGDRSDGMRLGSKPMLWAPGPAPAGALAPRHAYSAARNGSADTFTLEELRALLGAEQAERLLALRRVASATHLPKRGLIALAHLIEDDSARLSKSAAVLGEALEALRHWASYHRRQASALHDWLQDAADHGGICAEERPE